MHRFVSALMLLLVVSGCGLVRRAPAPAAPATVPELERLWSANPSDAAIATRLGAAYAQAGDLTRAREVLEAATALPEAPPRAWAQLGAVAEQQEDWDAAEAAYRSYMERADDAAARELAEGRIRLIERERMAARARALLAREAELAAESPDPSVVAVMPLLVEGAPEYEALGRGVAELLTTDLSLTDRLQVVERTQLNALLQEMKLTLGGFVDPRTAARTGSLTGAGRVVQGVVQNPGPEGVALDATVVTAARPDARVRMREEGALEELFDLEAELALSIYRELGIELTSAEVARIREHPTTNLQAFLAYSHGLRAMDTGAFDEARAHFQQATQLDPGFQEAAQVQQQAATLSTAKASSPSGVVPVEEVAQATETGEAEAAQGAEESEESSTETSSTMESLTSSVADAGAGAATETSGEAGSGSTSGGTSTPATASGSTSGTSTRGEGVVVDQVLQWTLQRPNPFLVRWRW